MRPQFDRGRKDPESGPSIRLRQNLFIQAGDDLRRELEWDIEVLSDEPRLKRAVESQMHESLVGRVIRVLEPENLHMGNALAYGDCRDVVEAAASTLVIAD